MRILLATDAWTPQVNGVVRTWTRVIEIARARGHQVKVIAPSDFRTVPLPTYAEIKLALFPRRRVRRLIEEWRPEAVHIATEGPIGLAARRECVARGLPFTTSYHTKFPEYVSARLPVPEAWGHAAMRWFHRPSSAILVATPSIQRELEARGHRQVRPWTRGVDTHLFHPERQPALDLPRPVFVYAGRVSVEKNVEAFLALDLPGSKLVIGDGPFRPQLQATFPDAHFVGMRHGEDLAAHYAAGDVFVFPSRTDTFGLVMLEAMASGLPVAAYPVPGPLDVVGQSGAGMLDDDLQRAALAALEIERDHVRRYAESFSWDATADVWLSNLQAIAHDTATKAVSDTSASRRVPSVDADPAARG